MKKFLLLFTTVMVVLSSCCSCVKKRQVSNVAPVELNVEHAIAMDRQAMFLSLKNNDMYRWYETCIRFTNFLDEENDGDIDMIVNVFQTIEAYNEKSYDTYVTKFQHFANGEVNKESVHGFWIEDWPLNEENIKVTFKQAFEAIQQTNYPKPHSKNVVLRKEVGPVETNPQWIFGNLHEQLYVDAVTGEVSPTSPSFPETQGFTMPLGEWP